MWGLSAAFGGEYLFNNYISLNGKTGYQWNTTSSNGDLSIDNLLIDVSKFGISLGESFGQIGLNLYF
jgi:hypothetical protein